MTEKSVAALVDTYKKTPGIELKEKTIAALGEFLYTNLNRFHLDYLTEDYRSDFIVTLYPRLGAIIEHFDSTKAAFGTYIRMVIRLSYRTFIKNRYGYEARQKVYETEETTRLLSIDTDQSNTDEWNSLVCENKTTYSKQIKLKETEKLSKKKKEIQGRIVFLLACKAAHYLDDSAIAQVALLSGYSQIYIREKLAEIHLECTKKRDIIQCSVEKQNSYYIRSQKCLYEMKYMDSDSSRHISLEKEYRYCTKRRDELRKKASKHIRTPSNRFLSVVLGISRGTIDATLASAMNHEYCDIS